ncbi:UNVERIFIED_ORG: hypothetical protein J2Y93_004669 [Pantoea agglomerans]
MNNLQYVKHLKIRPYSAIAQSLSREKIIEKIQFYGFIECAKMLRFLSVVVDTDFLDQPSLKYLLANINDCIDRHARGYSDENTMRYFNDLFILRDEIEYITSISKKITPQHC